MPTTKEWWAFDGVSVQELGYNITTIAGRFNVPSYRGEQPVYAYVEGEDFRPKIPAARVMSLAMWVQGSTNEGVMASDPLLTFNDNWRKLTQLFWTPRREMTITRRLWCTDRETGLPKLLTTVGKGQFVSGFEPTMTGRYRATFTVDLKLSDPFFYGDEVTSPRIYNGQTVTVNNWGDWVAAQRHMFIDLVGPMAKPVTLANITTDPNVVVVYDLTIPAGQTITLDVRNFAATAAVEEPSSTFTRNRIGYVRHSGTRNWMMLEPGASELKLTMGNTQGTGSDNSGYAVLRFRPPYV